MWLVLMLTCFLLGGFGSLKLHVIGLLMLALAAIGAAGALGWALAYPFMFGLMLAIGSVVAIQVGYFAGIAAQVWLRGRSAAEPQQQHLPPSKSDAQMHS